jgi:hypothetical protein
VSRAAPFQHLPSGSRSLQSETHASARSDTYPGIKPDSRRPSSIAQCSGFVRRGGPVNSALGVLVGATVR